jgi:hypothetical protein
MPELETTFHKMLNDTGYFHFRNYSALYIPLHKFTIELIFDHREIPDKYIILENQILHHFPKIYKKLTERGQIATIEKMLLLNRNNHADDNVEFVAHGAAKSGNIKLLRRLYQQDYQFNFLTTGAAAKAGKIKTLKWLIDHHAKLNDFVSRGAIKKGHMKILKYLIIDKRFTSRNGIFWAASYGRLKMIKFLLQSVNSASLDHVIDGAAAGGHLEILKFAFEHGQKMKTENFSCKHLHILQWLIENGHFKYAPEIIDSIALDGKLDCLQYLHSKGYNIFSKNVLTNAITSRNVELIYWLYDICPDKSPSNKYAIGAALTSLDKYDTHGSLLILKLLVNWGYSLANCDCTIPARNGDLDILQYLFELGCKLNENVINAAAKYGHLHIIIWCRQQGCDWSADTCRKTAQWNHLHVLKWLRGFDRKGSDETEICPWDARICIDAILIPNHIDVLEFALENGCWESECRAVLKLKDHAIIGRINNYYADLQLRRENGHNENNIQL